MTPETARSQYQIFARGNEKNRHLQRADFIATGATQRAGLSWRENKNSLSRCSRLSPLLFCCQYAAARKIAMPPDKKSPLFCHIKTHLPVNNVTPDVSKNDIAEPPGEGVGEGVGVMSNPGLFFLIAPPFFGVFFCEFIRLRGKRGEILLAE